MSTQNAAPRSPPARVLEWMRAWDLAVRGLLAEHPDPRPELPRPFSFTGLALALAMFGTLVAVVSRVGPHPFLLVVFLAFACLYAALVPLPLLLRPLGFGVPRDDSGDFAEAAAAARQAWEETASRAVAAWHVAREAALRRLDPFVLDDTEARAAAELIRGMRPPAAPLQGIDVGDLRQAAASPLTPLPTLEGWGGVAGGVVYMARRKPFTFGEVVIVMVGVAAVPPSLFLAIDGAATVVTCAVLPADACQHPEAGRNLFVLGMISLTGLVLLWRVVTRTRFQCPACGALVSIPRLAPNGKCSGCRRRVWVKWRR